MLVPAVLVVALLAGFWPGILATLAGALASLYFFIEPTYSFAIRAPEDVVALQLFVLVGIAVSGLASTLRQRNSRLQEFERVVEGLEEMIVVVDRDYRYLIANRAFLSYRGMKREDLIGRRIAEILNPGVFESTVKDKLDECLRGNVVRYEMRYDYPHLGERDLIISYFPIEGPDGIERVACVLRDVTERKHAENSLLESEDRYRDLVEHSEDLVCTHDLEGRLLSVNAAPARILGYTVEELLNTPMRDLVIPEGRELFDAYLERLRTTGGPEKGLLCVLTKSGAVRTWEYSNTLRSDGVAQPIVRGMAHDITERRRAELAFRASEGRYRTLFEKTVAGVAIIATSGEVIDCNDAWARMLGHNAAADCRGGQIQDCYRDPSQREELLSELERSGVFLNREWELRRADGNPLWVLLNSVLITEEGGPLIQSTMFDITERKRAEGALFRSEESYHSFVAQSSEGIFRQDVDAPIPIDLPEDELVQRILRDSYMAECNDAIAKMYGLSSVHDLLGRRLTEFLDPDDSKNVELTRHYIRSGFRVVNRESYETDAQGNGKVFCNSMTGIIEDGKLIGTWGIQRDVTEQVKAAEAREKAERALQASEAHFRELVEQASDGIATASPDGRWIDVNSAWAAMVGSTREEALQQVIGANLAPEDVPRLAPELERLRRGEISRAEWGIRRKDGSVLPCEIIAKQLPSGQIQVISRDITQRKWADQALRTSQRELSELAKQLETERARLIEAQAVAKVGSWEVDFPSLQITCSD